MAKEAFLKLAIGEIIPDGIERRVYRNTFNFEQANLFLSTNRDIIKDHGDALLLGSLLHANFPLDSSKDPGSNIDIVKPQSAFYTWFRSRGLLVVETTATGKDHTFLRTTINYAERRKMFEADVLSGHFSEEVTFQNQEKFPVMLFDKISSDDIITPGDPEFLIFMTLAQNSVLPLTEDGYIPQIHF